MKGTGAKRNVCPGSWVSTGAKFPVAPVESAPMRGRVRSPHISGGRPAAGSQHADSLDSCATQPACYSLGWDRQTDGSRYRLMPPYGGA